ncbi:MAG: pilin [bacterium]|nr:pilin [bacterium]
MKKIKIILLGVILAVGFLGSYNLTQAAKACCGMSKTAEGDFVSCMEPQEDGTCKNGELINGQTCAELKALGVCAGKAEIIHDANTPIEFKNPIKPTSVSEVLDSLLNNLMGLIVIVAVIFIIIGGIMYMTSAGNEAMVTRAKKTWTGATVGLAIALASPTFLKQIKEILNSNSNTGGTADNWVNKALTIKEIAINVLNFLLSIFGILAIIALVIGGGMYLTAYGDEKKIDSGKKIITYAIIGIVVALSALVVTRQIAGLIGVMAK